jgi:RNA recognition motif-containing protein
LKSLLNTFSGKTVKRKHDFKNCEDDPTESEESEESESDDDKEEVKYNHFKKPKIERDFGAPKAYEKHFEIFIDNFPIVTQDEIKEFFGQINENIKIKLLSKGGKFTGKGFLKFNTKKEAEDFLKKHSNLKMNKQKFNMRMINSEENVGVKSMEANIPVSFYTAFLGNLPTAVTDDKIKKHFKNISKIRLMAKEGKSKGFGYIDFKTEEDLNTAVSKNVIIDGKQVKIEKAKTSFSSQFLKDSKKLKKKRHRDN